MFSAVDFCYLQNVFSFWLLHLPLPLPRGQTVTAC